MTWWMWCYGTQRTPWILPLSHTHCYQELISSHTAARQNAHMHLLFASNFLLSPHFSAVFFCFLILELHKMRWWAPILPGSRMTALNSLPQLSLNWKAPKLHLLLLEWHNNYPSTQPANRISPSWRAQPIGYLNIWELICHSQQRPSHFFVSLKWVLLSSQISKDGFIIPTLRSTGTYETRRNIFRHLLTIQTTRQVFFFFISI